MWEFALVIGVFVAFVGYDWVRHGMAFPKRQDDPLGSPNPPHEAVLNTDHEGNFVGAQYQVNDALIEMGAQSREPPDSAGLS